MWLSVVSRRGNKSTTKTVKNYLFFAHSSAWLMFWTTCLDLMNAVLRVTQSSAIDMKKMNEVMQTQVRWSVPEARGAMLALPNILIFSDYTDVRRKSKVVVIFPHCLSLFFLQDRTMQMRKIFYSQKVEQILWN